MRYAVCAGVMSAQAMAKGGGGEGGRAVAEGEGRRDQRSLYIYTHMYISEVAEVSYR